MSDLGEGEKPWEDLPGDETENVRQSAANQKETSNAEPGDLNKEENVVQPQVGKFALENFMELFLCDIVGKEFGIAIVDNGDGEEDAGGADDQDELDEPVDKGLVVGEV